MTITEFIEARLAEDEHYARMALADTRHGKSAWIVDGKLALLPHVASDGLTLHVVRHDPARVLREVEAGRAILARHTPVQSSGRTMCATCLGSCTFWPCPDLRDLATIWRDHPGYDPSWAPNPT